MPDLLIKMGAMKRKKGAKMFKIKLGRVIQVHALLRTNQNLCFRAITSTIFDRYLHLELNMTAGMRNQSIQRVWGHVRKKINLVIFSEKNELPAFYEVKSKDFSLRKWRANLTRFICNFTS